MQTAGPPAPPQVLFRQLKFRNYPFEWVYDGLDPALLHKVVDRRKGMPLTLGALYLMVGARLGIPLEMKGQPPPSIQLPTGPHFPLSAPSPHAHADLCLQTWLVSMPEVALQPCIRELLEHRCSMLRGPHCLSLIAYCWRQDMSRDRRQEMCWLLPLSLGPHQFAFNVQLLGASAHDARGTAHVPIKGPQPPAIVQPVICRPGPEGPAAACEHRTGAAAPAVDSVHRGFRRR